MTSKETSNPSAFVNPELVSDIEVEERHALGRHGDAYLLRHGLAHSGKAYAEEGGKCDSVSQTNPSVVGLASFSCLTPSRVRFFFTSAGNWRSLWKQRVSVN